MKKTNLKKLLCAFLACLLCVSMFVSCGDGDEPTTGSTTPPPAAPALETLMLVENGESEYQIVVPKIATVYDMDAAYKLRLIVLTMTGKALPIVEDDTPAKDTEIVIGSTNARKSLFTAPVEYNGGYCVYTSGKRFVIEARSSVGMKKAMQNLAYDCFGVNIVFDDFYKGAELTELSVSTSYTISESFPATYYKIIYDGSYMQKRMAYAWKKLFLTWSSTHHIIEMDVYEEDPGYEGVQINFVTKDTVTDGNWELHLKSDGSYEINASDYYGFTAAGKYFSNYIALNKGKENPLPASTNGNYVTTLSRAEKSTAYAFEKTAEYRVMFNNILWGSPQPSERNTLNAAMVSIYMPDVLGLQEVNIGRRGDQEDGKGGIIAELAKLGYVETIDPRVKNAYATTEDIPGTDAYLTTNANEGSPLKGYGTGGATKVTVNDETFYTYYNCTPLLYNTATTKCLASGYYWYKSQFDKRPGAAHDNGASDCASKAATWGLFEDLASGEQYIAISTHMCTRSEYIRGLQGAEVVELVDSLIAQYNVPVMFGGDYNGTVTSSNFTAMKEGGMVDVSLNNLATIHTSEAASHHPYPEYDYDIKLVQPAPGDPCGSINSTGSIDRIMVKNHDTMEITVYGTVVDNYTNSSADHYPVFIDFSINSASSGEPTE